MILTLFVTFILIFIVTFLVYDSIKPSNYPPGPAWLPMLGSFLEYRKNLSKYRFHHLVWEHFRERYGNIVGGKMGRNLVVVVFSSAAIREIFTREEFAGRPDGFYFRLRTFGERLGIVFSEGQFWEKQRKFSVQHLRNLGLGRKVMEEKIQDEVHDLITTLNQRISKNNETDTTNCGTVWMHHAFDVSVINALWAMMAGERFQIDDARLSSLLEIIHDAFRANDISGGVLNQMPFLRYLAPEASGFTRLVTTTLRLSQFLEETVDGHKKTLCNEHTRDLIDAFLQKMNVKDDSTFTKNQLLSLCLDLFMAGSETTSNTLSFSMIYMLKYPEIQKKVQDEMDNVVGRNRWPNLQDRINLKYTECVINEIQRHANIPPLGIAHRATRNTELLGYRIPAGTMILTSLYSLHMNAEYWSDPHEFRPERFLNDNGNIAIDERYFIPFGFGKRRCLGESLAKANLYLFFTGFLHNFRLEMPGEEGPEPELEGFDGVTLSPKPFKAKLVPRND